MNELSAEYIKAVELDRRIKTSAQLAQQSLYDMCMGFKEMRDSRLYKELGYSEFNDYCKSETGFSDRQVYNYISIVEKLPKELVNSSSLIGVKKLTLLTKLSEDERSELTENTDLENTSVRELEEKVKQLKIKADKADMLSGRLDDMNGICDRISKQRDKAELRIRQLEAEIKELESRPIEVAVETDSKEVANLKDAMRRVDLDWSEKYSKLEEDSLKDRRELLQKAEQAEKDKQDKLSQLREELDRTKAEYEKKLSGKTEITPTQDDKAIFKAYLSTAVDSVTRLVGFVNEHNDSDNYGFFTQKARQLADIINSKLEV